VNQCLCASPAHGDSGATASSCSECRLNGNFTVSLLKPNRGKPRLAYSEKLTETELKMEMVELTQPYKRLEILKKYTSYR